jgi:hypothetical protein
MTGKRTRRNTRKKEDPVSDSNSDEHGHRSDPEDQTNDSDINSAGPRKKGMHLQGHTKKIS